MAALNWIGYSAQISANPRGFKLAARAGILMATLFLFAISAFAQSTAINGSIRGRVTDQTGAAVPDATVTVSNQAMGITKTIQTGQEGYYLFPNLPLGTYTVSVKKDGFTTLQFKNVLLEAGKEAVMDAQLKLGSVSTEVEVTSGAPIVEPARVNVGRNIDEREINNLPLTSRNPYNFILFQPGVSGHPNPELGIPRTVNTNGLMDRINYQMDGMVDTQGDRHGLRLFPISDVYVKEVQTVANSFAPEFGGTAGNIYNVITNSGSNVVHGQFQYLRRWIDATAMPILSKPGAAKPQLKLNDYTANLGAPIIKDKLFVFAAYEHLTRGVPFPNTIKPADASALGLSSDLLATAPGLLHGQFFDIRLDWNMTPRNQMFVRYNYFRNDFPYNTNVGGLNALDAASDFKDRAHVIGTQIVSTISPNLLNEFRFSWPYRNNTHFAGDKTGPGPAISIPGVANFNGSTGAGDRFAEKIPNFNENLTYVRGKHTFKVGMNLSKILDLQRSRSYNQYTFPSIAAYLAAKSGADPYGYTRFVSVQDPTGVGYHSLFWGAYAQDSWQVTPSLLMIYGFRYDRFQAPDANPNAPFVYSRSFNVPNGDFAPRFGLAWRLNQKTVVRASTGIFYDATPTNLWFHALNEDGTNRTRNTNLAPTDVGAPAFPNIVSVPLQVQDVTTVDPNFKNAYTVNANLQITRELSNNDALTIGYVFTGGRQLAYLYNMNLINPTGTLADGRPIFDTSVSAATRLYPDFNNITLQASGANSSYNALLLTYQRRFSHGFQMSASYTYSHSISDAPDVNSFEQNLPIEDPTNMLRDRGNSSVNRPHALTISSVIQPTLRLDNKVLNYLLNDNMFAILGNISSGDQQNIRANTILNGDGITGSVTRPLFIGRNTVRGPSIYQVDLRYTRTFANLWERVHPQFVFEANNLFNHPNVTSLNTVVKVDSNTGAPLAALPTTWLPSGTVLEGRIVQFGFGVRW